MVVEAFVSVVCPDTESVPVAIRLVVEIFDDEELVKNPLVAVTDVNDGVPDMLIVLPDHVRLVPSEIRDDGVT